MRVLVTGAAAGIGLAIARARAAQGATCLLVDREGARAAQQAALLPGPGHAALRVDLADAAARIALARAAGPLDLLVLNAGISDSSGAGLAEASPDRLAALQAVNLEAPLHLAALLAPGMPRGGRIVTLASGAGLRALPFRGGYSATKAGLIAATRALARRLAPRGIAVTGIAPGFVRTDLVEGLITAGRLDPAQAVAKVPLGRMATPDEIAAALLGLSALPGVSGQVLAVDGGSAAFGGSVTLPAALAPGAAPGPGRVLGEGPVAEAFGRADTGIFDTGIFDTGDADLPALAATAARHLPALAGTGAGMVILTGDEDCADPALAARAAARRMAAQVLACEWGRRGVRVNALQSGPHATPEMLAAAARFLLSPAASYVSGAVLAPGCVPVR
jgi:NAD(P)-dependent dehydrogenase (short-subunit alcohol dehydrogenase family)